MSAPLRVVAVDGGDARVVDQLIQTGRLPALARLQDRGVSVAIDPPGELLEDCVWPSLLSGQPLGNIGLAHFMQFEPATMSIQRVVESDVEPYWMHLPDRGRGAVAIEAPQMHPHPDSNAEETCCWHSFEPTHSAVITSPRLARSLRTLGRPPVLSDSMKRQTIEKDVALAQQLAVSLRFRGRSALLAARGRDTFFLGIHEMHATVHRLGHHFDPRHWYRHEQADPEIVTSAYEELDRALLPFIDDFPGNVVVAFARGMRPANPAAHLLEELLVRGGLLARRDTHTRSPGHRGERAWLTEGLRRLTPDRMRERIATTLLPADMQYRLLSRRFRDRYQWAATMVFPVPAWTNGLLRANVVGREAAGAVPPDECAGVIETAARLIMETHDADTGKPLAREVLHAPSVFPGTNQHLLPDLIVQWSGDRPARRARHPVLGEWAAEPEVQRLTFHSSGGLVVMAGPSVRAIDMRVQQDHLGFAPTLLRLKEMERPSVMPGGAWNDVLAS